MAGEIQLNSTTMATESSGSITAELDTIRPNTTNGSLTLQGDSSNAGVTGLTIDSSGNATFAQTITGGTIGSSVVFQGQFNVIPNWYLAEQQITGGNDVSAGFYAGSTTASERRTVNIPAVQLRINATVYTLSTTTTLDADTTGSWASNETSKATAAIVMARMSMFMQ